MQDLISVYRMVASRSDYALHLGLTEAGMGSKGIVASSAALGVLLQEGIGDTIRVSLTPEPGGDRTLEVKVAQEILQTMGFRTFVPLVAACPGCGRTTSTVFQELARDIQAISARRCRSGARNIRASRPSTSRSWAASSTAPANPNMPTSAFRCPAPARAPAAPVFIDGKKAMTLRGEGIAEEFKQIVDDYVARRYGGAARRRNDRRADAVQPPMKPAPILIVIASTALLKKKEKTLCTSARRRIVWDVTEMSAVAQATPIT